MFETLIIIIISIIIIVNLFVCVFYKTHNFLNISKLSETKIQSEKIRSFMLNEISNVITIIKNYNTVDPLQNLKLIYDNIHSSSYRAELMSLIRDVRNNLFFLYKLGIFKSDDIKAIKQFDEICVEFYNSKIKDRYIKPDRKDYVNYALRNVTNKIDYVLSSKIPEQVALLVGEKQIYDRIIKYLSAGLSLENRKFLTSLTNQNADVLLFLLFNCKFIDNKTIYFAPINEITVDEYIKSEAELKNAICRIFGHYYDDYVKCELSGDVAKSDNVVSLSAIIIEDYENRIDTNKLEFINLIYDIMNVIIPNDTKKQKEYLIKSLYVYNKLNTTNFTNADIIYDRSIDVKYYKRDKIGKMFMQTDLTFEIIKNLQLFYAKYNFDDIKFIDTSNIYKITSSDIPEGQIVNVEKMFSMNYKNLNELFNNYIIYLLYDCFEIDKRFNRLKIINNDLNNKQERVQQLSLYKKIGSYIGDYIIDFLFDMVINSVINFQDVHDTNNYIIAGIFRMLYRMRIILQELQIIYINNFEHSGLFTEILNEFNKISVNFSKEYYQKILTYDKAYNVFIRNFVRIEYNIFENEIVEICKETLESEKSDINPSENSTWFKWFK